MEIIIQKKKNDVGDVSGENMVVVVVHLTLVHCYAAAGPLIRRCGSADSCGCRECRSSGDWLQTKPARAWPFLRVIATQKTMRRWWWEPSRPLLSPPRSTWRAAVRRRLPARLQLTDGGRYLRRPAALDAHRPGYNDPGQNDDDRKPGVLSSTTSCRCRCSYKHPKHKKELYPKLKAMRRRRRRCLVLLEMGYHFRISRAADQSCGDDDDDPFRAGFARSGLAADGCLHFQIAFNPFPQKVRAVQNRWKRRTFQGGFVVSRFSGAALRPLASAFLQHRRAALTCRHHISLIIVYAFLFNIKWKISPPRLASVTTWRVRDWLPAPHWLSQADHGPHSDTWQSWTEEGEKEEKISEGFWVKINNKTPRRERERITYSPGWCISGVYILYEAVEIFSDPLSFLHFRPPSRVLTFFFLRLYTALTWR